MLILIFNLVSVSRHLQPIEYSGSDGFRERPDRKHPCNFLLVLLGTFALGAFSFHVKLPTALGYLAMLGRLHVGALGASTIPA